MIELHVLGAIEVDGLEPSDAEALLTHPRWIATLACVLLPDRGEARRREELAPLLWPSSDRSRGRLSLRGALHGLRRHLGHETIRSRGDELVVDRERLSCDVHLFETRLAQRRYEEALALYGGDLLPGLSVPEAPAFETWLSERRESLRRRAADAAWMVSGSAERRGRWIEAVSYARRAVEHSPSSEAAVRRLLELLDRAGDGTSALDEYRRHADRWRRELGVEPSAETRAVVEEIRRGRDELAPVDGDLEPVSSAAPARTDRWTDADRIVVLPFAIQGEDPSLAHLASGLAHDVIASLARVSGIVVVARPSTEQSVGGIGRAPVEIGRRLEADVVLDSSVRIVGERFLLVGRLVDVRLQRPVWADVYDGTRSEILAMRRRLLFDVLDAAGVRLSAVEEERLVRGQTASPEAFELYLEGHSRLGLRTGEENEAAIERFEAALALDPDFALARAGLMDAFAQRHPTLGHRLSETGLLAHRAAREALALDPELGEVHATLGLLRGFVDHEWDSAVADLRRAIELSPGYASAHHWLGAVLTFGRREFDEGARELEIARQLDPYSPAIRADIGLAHANRGDLDGARRLLSDLARDEASFWRAAYYLGVTCFAAGEPESGADHLRRAWRLGSFGAQADHAGPESAGPGSWRDVLERRLSRLETSGLQPGIRAVEAALLSMVLGRRTDAIRWLGNVTEQGSAAWILAFLPVFEPLVDQPAFREFLAEAGLIRPDITAS